MFVYNEQSEQIIIAVTKECLIKKTLVSKIKMRKGKQIQMINDFSSSIISLHVVNDISNAILTILTDTGKIKRMRLDTFSAIAFGGNATGTCTMEADCVVDSCISKSDTDNTILMVMYKQKDGSFGYKATYANQWNVKGRISQFVTSKYGKEFACAMRVYIGGTIMLFNDIEVVKKQGIGKPFPYTIGDITCKLNQ